MAPKLNSSINEEVGADKRLGRKLSQSDARLEALIEEITTNGFAVLPDPFTPEQVEEAKAELRVLDDEATGSVRGRNSFEGLRTQRFYALANKSRVFDKFALHPLVLALNDHFMDPGYLLSSFQGINIQPGEAPQTLHHDDGYVTVPRPHRPFGAVS